MLRMGLGLFQAEAPARPRGMRMSFLGGSVTEESPSWAGEAGTSVRWDWPCQEQGTRWKPFH